MIVLAQEEARALGHDYLGTEHILLGLLREEEGLGARILGSLDVTVERVRAQVVQIVGAGEQVTAGQIPFTPRAAKVLELALREALSLGNSFIGTEHILLGLIDENEGIAARILLGSDAESEKIRDEVIHAGPAPPPPSSPVAPQTIYAPPEPLAEPSDVELGWRRRPIALAALGAAALARTAFDRPRTGQLEPLEMQVLAYLALALRHPTVAADAGELFDSLLTALACDRDDLERAVGALVERRLVRREEDFVDEPLISITIAGTIAVESWLDQTAPLFGGWPPDQPAADDATG